MQQRSIKLRKVASALIRPKCCAAGPNSDQCTLHSLHNYSTYHIIVCSFVATIEPSQCEPALPLKMLCTFVRVTTAGPRSLLRVRQLCLQLTLKPEQPPVTEVNLLAVLWQDIQGKLSQATCWAFSNSTKLVENKLASITCTRRANASVKWRSCLRRQLVNFFMCLVISVQMQSCVRSAKLCIPMTRHGTPIGVLRLPLSLCIFPVQMV